MTVTELPSHRFAQASSAAAHVHTVAANAAKPVSQATRSPMGKRIILPAMAAITVGAAAFATLNRDSQPRARADPLQNQNNALMDSYGDKGSLEDLQKAIEAYEKK